MNGIGSARRPGGGRSGAWWARWVAIVGGAWAFAWALATILSRGAPAGRAENRPPAESFSLSEQAQEDSERHQAFWEHENPDDEAEGWEEEHGAAPDLGFAGPVPTRRTPDAFSRPS